MPYTNRSRENLLREGIAGQNIYVTGNPINEVMLYFSDRIAASTILSRLEIKEKNFFLVTMHRAENVDIEQRLSSLVEALVLLHEQFQLPVLCSLHPRTRSKAKQFGINLARTGLNFLEPFGFFDFIRLQQAASCVLSDSGTVQEETCILGVPSVTIRDVTERPETIECGSNVLAGNDAQTIVKMVHMVTRQKCSWQPPAGLLRLKSPALFRESSLGIIPKAGKRYRTLDRVDFEPDPSSCLFFHCLKERLQCVS